MVLLLLGTISSALALQMFHNEPPPVKQKPQTIEQRFNAIDLIIQERDIAAVSVAMVNEDGPVLIKT
jgi:hypothetical protein